MILGADGSRLDDGATMYVLPARQIVDTDYWHGYQPHVEKGVVFVCQTVDEFDYYNHELLAVGQPSYVVKAIRAVQRLHRARRAARPYVTRMRTSPGRMGGGVGCA